MCVGNMQDLYPGYSEEAMTALYEAVLAHETAHMNGMTCENGNMTENLCGHPCAFDAEVAKWEELFNSGQCDAACQILVNGEVCGACSNASPAVKQGSFCTGQCP